MALDVRQLHYDVRAVFADGASCSLAPALTGLGREDAESELSQRLTLALDGDVLIGDTGHSVADLVVPGVRLVELASEDGGASWWETFRGVVWEWSEKDWGDLELTVYDELLYLTQSEDARVYPEGMTGAAVLKDLLGAWLPAESIGKIDGPTVQMPKLVLQGTIAEMVMDVLQGALALGDKAYWIRMVYPSIDLPSQVEVTVPGANHPIYVLQEGSDDEATVESVSERWSLDGVATEVRVFGATAETTDQGRPPIQATATASDAGQIGTLVAVLNGQEFDTQGKADEAARTELEKRREPKRDRSVTVPCIPWLRRGDLVRVKAGRMDGLYQASGISWDEDALTMTLGLSVQGSPLYQAKAISDPQAGAALGSDANPSGSVAAGSKRAQLLAWCKAHLGTAYVWAGGHPGLISGGWDCSGYADHAYAAVGVPIGWDGTGGMEVNPKLVRTSSPRPGDLVLFPGHVGVYAGGDSMYNASDPSTGTIVSSVSRSAAYHGGGPDYRRVVGLDG